MQIGPQDQQKAILLHEDNKTGDIGLRSLRSGGRLLRLSGRTHSPHRPPTRRCPFNTPMEEFFYPK